jgi:hypothetical protein
MLWIAAAVALAAGCMEGAQGDACALLSPSAIRKATGEVATHTKATAQTVGKLRQLQCFYSLPTFTNSISVTVMGPAGTSRDAAREVWERWFHRAEERSEPQSEEEEAARQAAPVSGIGDEAYWVHSFVGNLYVRKGDRFLRISLGGKLDDAERQARAKALAEAALKNLR